MSKVIDHGPNGTAVAGVAAVTFPVTPLNFDEDFLKLPSKNGSSNEVIYTDVTAPVDRPSTLRYVISTKPNIYAGTSVDSSVMLANKRATDIYIEAREIWSKTDTVDATFLKHAMIRGSIGITIPDDADITSADVIEFLGRLTAAIAAMGDDDLAAGIAALRRGVVQK